MKSERKLIAGMARHANMAVWLALLAGVMIEIAPGPAIAGPLTSNFQTDTRDEFRLLLNHGNVAGMDDHIFGPAGNNWSVIVDIDAGTDSRLFPAAVWITLVINITLQHVNPPHGEPNPPQLKTALSFAALQNQGRNVIAAPVDKKAHGLHSDILNASLTADVNFSTNADGVDLYGITGYEITVVGKHVPEPNTFALSLVGAFGMLGNSWLSARRKRQKSEAAKQQEYDERSVAD